MQAARVFGVLGKYVLLQAGLILFDLSLEINAAVDSRTGNSFRSTLIDYSWRNTCKVTAGERLGQHFVVMVFTGHILGTC